MKIGIDASCAIYEKAGIGKYTYNSVQHLLKVDRQNEYVLFFNFFRHRSDRIREIDGLVKGAKAKFSIQVSNFPGLLKDWLTLSDLPLNRIFTQEIDIFHAPYFASIAKTGFAKQIVTIHDLAFLKYPEHAGTKLSNYYLKRTKLAINNSQKIIAVSRATEQDLVEMLGVDPKKIKVIYEASAAEFKPQKDQNKIRYVLAKYHLPPEYILSVCTLEPRKNLVRLVQAYAQMPHQMQYKLVLAGGNGWNNQSLLDVIADLNLKTKVIMPGYIDQEDLPTLYSAAKVFVYPSLYEGFGLPVLEALSCGTPVITSETSSLPEITGRAAILVNPYKEEQIAYALKNVAGSEKLQKSLSERGLKRAKQFSWEKSAVETIKVYQKLER